MVPLDSGWMPLARPGDPCQAPPVTALIRVRVLLYDVKNRATLSSAR